MTDGPDWKRLGEFALKRRLALRYSQADVQARGGPSGRTLQLVEHGKVTSLRQHTKSGLEDALGWARGSVDRILAGGDPVLALPEGTAGRVELLHEESGERLLIDIVSGAGELSDERRREILALIRQMQKADTQR